MHALFPGPAQAQISLPRSRGRVVRALTLPCLEASQCCARGAKRMYYWKYRRPVSSPPWPISPVCARRNNRFLNPQELLLQPHAKPRCSLTPPPPPSSASPGPLSLATPLRWARRACSPDPFGFEGWAHQTHHGTSEGVPISAFPQKFGTSSPPFFPIRGTSTRVTRGGRWRAAPSRVRASSRLGPPWGPWEGRGLATPVRGPDCVLTK